MNHLIGYMALKALFMVLHLHCPMWCPIDSKCFWM